MSEYNQHIAFMQRALAMADRAAALGEVPVGAVLVHQQQVIAEAFNAPIQHSDPCAHAEIQVLREAGRILGNYRLNDTVLYVTLEPCVMCVGALLHARIKHLVYGADEPKMGAVQSVFPLLQSERHCHQITCTSGILADACKQRMQAFFQQRRAHKKIKM